MDVAHLNHIAAGGRRGPVFDARIRMGAKAAGGILIFDEIIVLRQLFALIVKDPQYGIQLRLMPVGDYFKRESFARLGLERITVRLPLFVEPAADAGGEGD